MHNVRKKRTTEEQEARRKEREAVQIKNYNHLMDQCRQMRMKNQHDQEALKSVTKLLAWNPETYTSWNFRREILVDLFKGMTTEEKQKCLNNELMFIMERLKEFPKVYWIWNHRRWCLEQLPEPDWQMELGLISNMLEYDSRNFMGWQYRRYVVKALEDASNQSITKQELDYTVKKINANFSNFSAWHNRAKLIPRFLKESGQDTREFWTQELDYVRQGLYTDPDDQSCWIYHRWLIMHHEEIVPDCSNEELIGKVQYEINSIDELHQVEPENKWSMLSLVDYYRYLNKLQGQANNVDKMKQLLSQLEAIDPMRQNRYRHLASQL